MLKIKLIICVLISFCFIATNAYSYWIWTPKTKKWTNPKQAAKDIPKEQFDWAMKFFNKKKFKRAIKEFRKLINTHPKSSFAAKSQFYIGEILMEMNKYYDAYLEYQKTIEKYPGAAEIPQILERELQIANHFFHRDQTKFAGIKIPKDYMLCAEIYEQIVKNAPYAKHADQAQFFLGESYRFAGQFDKSVEAYDMLIEKYAESAFVVEAKYKKALCVSTKSLDADYDSKKRDKAIKEFEKFTKEHGQSERIEEARTEMTQLLEKNAKKMFEIAKFYEKQKQYDAAILYYEDLFKKYPETEYGIEAQVKIEKLRVVTGG